MLLASLLACALSIGAAVPTSALGQAAAELVTGGLDAPVFLTAPQGDSRLFVVERAGRIRIVTQRGAVLPFAFLDITAKVGTAGEGGLLGLAFAPDYDQSGHFYVYYTDLAGDSVVSRFSVSPNPALAIPTEQVILTLSQPADNHNGGTIAFGPDGFLWIGTGDGGGAYDPSENAQDPESLLGKMLRIDPGPAFAADSIVVAQQAYRVPASNPFVGIAGIRDEIWAFGLRNPYRWSFDRSTGDLWIADVGQAKREEIDFEPALDSGGRNYGWDVMEGPLCNATDPYPGLACRHPWFTPPVYFYGHSGKKGSITGGYVHRGPISTLSGLYFFGDYRTGQVWTLDPATLEVTSRTNQLGAAGGVGFSLVAFGEDGVGRLYLVLIDGRIFRIVAADPQCADGIDNDADGWVDYPADAGCPDAASDLEGPECHDGLDNDGDGAIDLADADCEGPTDGRERSSCGLGFEVALLLAVLAPLRARRRRGP